MKYTRKSLPKETTIDKFGSKKFCQLWKDQIIELIAISVIIGSIVHFVGEAMFLKIL